MFHVQRYCRRRRLMMGEETDDHRKRVIALPTTGFSQDHPTARSIDPHVSLLSAPAVPSKDTDQRPEGEDSAIKGLRRIGRFLGLSNDNDPVPLLCLYGIQTKDAMIQGLVTFFRTGTRVT
jgi:hypothetical protein